MGEEMLGAHGQVGQLGRADARTGQRAVDIARAWIGTPYHHQASVRGVGCDCLGLVRGVYAELYGRVAEEPPAYSRDLAEATGRETLIEAARRHLVEVPPFDEMRCGDVLIFRLREGAMAKHCGIATEIDAQGMASRMIHAFESGPVCEVSLNNWWQRRFAAVFRFPEVTRDD
jgi:NlpC/P60 family putative phage cell wall peptidase